MFHHKEIVKFVLEQLTVNITVLTVIQGSDSYFADWQGMESCNTPEDSQLLKISGFIKEDLKNLSIIMDDQEAAIEWMEMDEDVALPARSVIILTRYSMKSNILVNLDL